MAFNRGRILALGCAIAGLLITAPAALAGTIRYTVAPNPVYTIQDNGNGIVKVTYNGCVTATIRQQLDFTLTTTVAQSANAVFSILKAEGESPTTTFTPPSVDLVKGVEQKFAVSLGFTISQANNAITTFRIKLDPATGEGLGQGAGIMVHIPCVLAAPPPPPPGTPGATNTPGEPGTPGTTATPGTPAPLTESAVLTAPTAGVFQTVAGAVASGRSRCISTPRGLRLRAGETTRIVATVITNGQRIQGAAVRATYPGGKFAKRTRADGTAVFNIRPSRSGRVILQSDVCFGAKRFAIRGARVVKRQRAARVTG